MRSTSQDPLTTDPVDIRKGCPRPWSYESRSSHGVGRESATQSGASDSSRPMRSVHAPPTSRSTSSPGDSRCSRAGPEGESRSGCDDESRSPRRSDSQRGSGSGRDRKPDASSPASRLDLFPTFRSPPISPEPDVGWRARCPRERGSLPASPAVSRGARRMRRAGVGALSGSHGARFAALEAVETSETQSRLEGPKTPDIRCSTRARSLLARG